MVSTTNIRTLFFGALMALGMAVSVVLPARASSDQSASDTATTECVDGSDAQKLATTIDRGVATIQTKDGGLLCKDIEVFFSSYIMPDNYNGEDFFDNPTATPQSLYDSNSVTLQKDTDGFSILEIDLPAENECKNVQVDVYYAPEIEMVGPDGHGKQNILSVIYEKNAVLCMDGGDQGGQTPVVTPPVVTPPVVNGQSGTGGAGQTLGSRAANASSLPAALPATGISASAASQLVMVLAMGTLVYICSLRLTGSQF